MPSSFYKDSKLKIYLENHKIKKGYCGDKLVYTCGNTVTYVANGINYYEDVEEGASVLSPTSFTPGKPGWTFRGWSLSNTNHSVQTNLIMGESPMTLYAVWSQGESVPDQPISFSYDGPALDLEYSPRGAWEATAWVDKPDAITNATTGIMYLSISVNGRGRSWQIPSEGHSADAVEDTGTAGYGGKTFTISGGSTENIKGTANPDPEWTGGQSWYGGDVHVSNVILKGYNNTNWFVG